LDRDKEKVLIRNNNIKEIKNILNSKLKSNNEFSEKWIFKPNSKIKYNNSLDKYYYNNTKIHECIYYKDIDLEESLFELQDNKLKVKFKAESNIDLTLHILAYDKNNENKLNLVLKPNEVKYINMESNLKFKVFLRVKGCGYFIINGIKINNEYIWDKVEKELSDKFDGFYKWSCKKNSKIKYDIRTGEYKYKNITKHEYINYINNEFSINLKKGTHTLEFYAESNIDLQLHIIGEKNGERVLYEFIRQNGKVIFTNDIDISAKVFIRVKGDGYFKINNILLDNITLWNSNKDILNIINYSKNSIKNENRVVIDNPNIYYSIDDNILLSKLKGKQFAYIKLEEKLINCVEEKCLYVNLNYKSTKDILVKLVAKIINYDGTYKIVELSEVDLKPIKLYKYIEKIEYYIKISGEGYLSIPILEFDEISYKPSNKIDLEINDNKWFNNYKKEIGLKYDKTLKGNINIGKGLKRYISYVERNNDYSKVPKNHIIDIDDKKIYKFKISIDNDDTLDINPMLIFYDNNKKIEVLQLAKNKENQIIPPINTKYIRIALRAIGYGCFDLKNIIIEEYNRIEVADIVNWKYTSELNYFNLGEKKYINDFKMAVIMDEFTTACYEDECRLIKVSPNNWKAELIQNKPDILFVESAWKGNGGQWFKKVGDYGKENNKELYELVNWCKHNNIPTVFWNKEDPVHFNRFVNTAKIFDYIFTTDENSVKNYIEMTGNKNVYSLPFGAQPKKHNPIKLYEERINKACFAGSYYKLHEERRVDMEMILDEVLEYGLDIYDRNYEAVKKGIMPNHEFPERFKNNIRGSLKYYEIDKAYKGYKLMVNLNTVKYSPTMFSRRVFEGLACGTPVISSYSLGMQEMFKDIVYIAKENGDLKKQIPKLLNNEEYYNRVSMKGMREVLNKHTYEDRLAYILDKLELPYKRKEKFISVIGIAKSKKDYYKILDIYNNQKYKYKKLIIFIEKFDGYIDLFNDYNSNGIYTYILSYMHNYGNASELIDTEYMAFIDTNNYYGSNYLSDLIMSTKYVDVDVIGKGMYYTVNNNKLIKNNKGKDFVYVSDVDSTACICRTKLFILDNFNELLNSYKEIKFNKYIDRGKQIFSSDSFNYIKDYYKENKNLTLHEEISF
ncbi:CgeB family protein, partial [Clostridium tertium]